MCNVKRLTQIIRGGSIETRFLVRGPGADAAKYHAIAEVMVCSNSLGEAALATEPGKVHLAIQRPCRTSNPLAALDPDKLRRPIATARCPNLARAPLRSKLQAITRREHPPGAFSASELNADGVCAESSASAPCSETRAIIFDGYECPITNRNLVHRFENMRAIGS